MSYCCLVGHKKLHGGDYDYDFIVAKLLEALNREAVPDDRSCNSTLQSCMLVSLQDAMHEVT